MNTVVRRGTRIVLLLAGVAVCLGCSRRDDEGASATSAVSASKPAVVTSEPPKPGRSFAIGVSLRDEREDFCRRMAAAMRDAASRNDLTLDLQSADANPQTQSQQVAGFLGRGVNAIILCPTDSAGASSAVLRANAAKVPIFTIGIAANQGAVVSHFVSDDEQGGRLAAQKMALLLHDSGEVLLLGDPSNRSARERCKGFLDEIKRHPGLLPLSEQPKDSASMTALSGLKLNGIFAADAASALGALSACARAHRNDIAIVADDGAPPAPELIKQGANLKAEVVSDPERMGRIAIETVARYLRGEKTSRLVPISPAILDVPNVYK